MSQNVSTVRSLHKYAQSLGVDVYFDFMMMAECNGKNDNLSVRINLEQAEDMLQFRIDSQPKLIEAIKYARGSFVEEICPSSDNV